MLFPAGLLGKGMVIPMVAVVVIIRTMFLNF